MAGLRYRLKTFGELANRHPPRWLVADLIQCGGLIAVYGESTAGKSFFSLDLGAHIAMGKRWAGRRVRKARVIYVTLEGDSANRAKAYERENGTVEGMEIIEGVFFNLTNDDDVKTFIRDIKAQLGNYDGPVLVIIDTWARAISGADENTGTDVGRAIENCARIQVALGATVMFIHHAGKDVTRGMRGWSGLKAAIEGEVLVERNVTDGNRYATFTKVKDGQDGLSVGFDLTVVDLGPRSAYDPEADDDERDTSCIVRVSNPKAEKPERKRVGATERAIMGVVNRLGEVEVRDIAKEIGKTENAIVCAINRLLKHEPLIFDGEIVRRIKPS